MDSVSSEMIGGGIGFSGTGRRLVEVFVVGLSMLIPNVLNTLLAAFLRPGVLPGRVFSLEEEPGEVTVARAS
jgi:hypothetical protein